MTHLGTFLAFRFITGLTGAAFMSVAGGSVSDMFVGHSVPTYVVIMVFINVLDLTMPFR